MRTATRGLRRGFLVLLCSFVGGSPASPDEPTQGVCGYCRTCGSDMMEADPLTPFGIAWPQSCIPEICTPNPDCCGPADDALALNDLADYESLTARIVAADGPELRRLLANHAGSLTLNRDRQAIQLIGRDCVPLGHYPLRDGQFAGFRD